MNIVRPALRSVDMFALDLAECREMPRSAAERQSEDRFSRQQRAAAGSLSANPGLARG